MLFMDPVLTGNLRGTLQPPNVGLAPGYVLVCRQGEMRPPCFGHFLSWWRRVTGKTQEHYRESIADTQAIHYLAYAFTGAISGRLPYGYSLGL